MDRRTLLTRAVAAACAPALTALPLQADTAPVRIRELYNKDNSLSDFALNNEGKRVTFQGFMAPPLKIDTRFFVLTKLPMAVCTFCESEADWPNDILAVYGKRGLDVSPFNVKIHARGILRLGQYRDPDTGFFSMVRL